MHLINVFVYIFKATVTQGEEPCCPKVWGSMPGWATNLCLQKQNTKMVSIHI